MYWEDTVSISNFWNNILHVVLELHLVIILIIIFCSLKTVLFFTDFLHSVKLFSVTAWEYLLTYLLHGSESFLRSYPVFSKSRNSPTFYGTRRFITAFTSACHLSLSKVSVQVWGFLCKHFVTRYVFTSC